MRLQAHTMGLPALGNALRKTVLVLVENSVHKIAFILAGFVTALSCALRIRGPLPVRRN